MKQLILKNIISLMEEKIKYKREYFQNNLFLINRANLFYSSVYLYVHI
jgi:hypothetical protein